MVINNKRFMYTFLIIGIISLTLGVTISFFNYTRTGGANAIRVGRIAFNTTQEGNISLTNVFPMSTEEFEGGSLDPNNNVTINITGDTTYPNGIEYLVTAEDVHVEINEKRIPLTLKVTTNSDLGSNDPDYFTNRGGNTSIHKVLSGGVIVPGQYLVVGYLAPGQTGIEGSLNISAYINSDNIAISDTYDETESDNMGTTSNWVRNRTVFTTEEWNSFSTSNNPLSFKVRVEANEGIWVDEATTPNLMNTISINRGANITEIRFIQETPLRMERRYAASPGSESNGTKMDITYQDTGKVLAWIEEKNANLSGLNNTLNTKPSFLINENDNNNIEQIDNEPEYILYIASSGDTKWVYTGSSNLFGGFTNVEKIVFENFDTSSIPIMNDMFKDLSSLTSVNVTALDTSGVYQMTGMFSGCSSLTSIDLSGLGSDNLTAIANMFGNCTGLQEIIMKNFNFGHVNFNQSFNNTNYYYAFAYLPNVETIDLTNANTSGVTNMLDMFYNCKKLRNIIGLNTLDTSNVTNMEYMFSECDALINLDLSNFNTSSVQTMGSMFYGCDNLISLNLSGLGSDNLSTVGSMFRGCTSLKNINMSNFNFGIISSFESNDNDIFYWVRNVLETINLSGANFSGPNITSCNFNSMFYECTKLKSVDLSNANTSKVTNMYGMFYSCYLLENVNLDNLDTSNVTTIGYMFRECRKIKKLDLRNLNTSNVTEMGYAFSFMDELEEIDISGWGSNNLSNINNIFTADYKLKTIIMNDFNFGVCNYGTYDLGSTFPSGSSSLLETVYLNNAKFSSSTYRLFYGCTNLKNVYLENVDTSSVTNMGGMFENCSSLTSLDLSSFDTHNVTRMDGMFSGCTNLKTIYASQDWDTSKLTSSNSSSGMFSGCTSLVGGNGTVFDSTKTDKTMAVIDTPSTPGYLTLKTT